MAIRNAAPTDRSKVSGATKHRIEQKVVAFAETLGFLLGTVQAKADGWRGSSERNRTARPSGLAPARPSRGPVDAPGKHHRKPPPREPINKRMGEPRGKQMGQKTSKNERGGGRG
jgi:hypothetical protein